MDTPDERVGYRVDMVARNDLSWRAMPDGKVQANVDGMWLYIGRGQHLIDHLRNNCEELEHTKKGTT